MPLKTMGTFANPAVSIQSLMQGIELERSYRSNVPAARGLAGCSSLAMDSDSHLACRAKRHFWNQWDVAAGSQWILGIRYIASNKNKHLSALRQGYNRCKPLTEEYVVQPMRHHVSAIQLSCSRHLLFDYSPNPKRPIGTRTAPLKQKSAHSTSTHFRVPTL